MVTRPSAAADRGGAPVTSHESAIQAGIEAVERNARLREEACFDGRADAIDYLDFDIIDRINGLLRRADPARGLIALKQHAERVKRGLEEVDAALFRRLRTEIRAGRCSGRALRRQILEYVGPGRRADKAGYDNLDVFIDELLLTRAVPRETRARESEMVGYQQTPARVIFELVAQAHLTRDDVFYDLGSGLGRVSLLVTLLTGVRVLGIEVEPAYCDYAAARAADLSLGDVEFINTDARAADYSEGTVFFLYTPFVGRMLQNVLGKLRRVSRRKPIRLFTYGPCTPEVSRESWLRCTNQDGRQIYELAAFRVE